MAREVCDHLVTNPGGRYFDATLGGGGHSSRILARLSPEGRLAGTDPDPRQLERARSRIGDDPRMTFWRGWADEAAGLLSKNGFLPLDGVLADFGLSHDQLDDPSRGFSFRFPDSPLDMRFDPEGPATAAGILNGTDIEGYRALLAEGGVARGAEALARRLSASGPFQTVGDLVAVAGPRRGRIHPATVLFQAVRMKVNREIERIRRLLAQIPGWLRPGGRAVFLSYHSVEDRLVKQALRGGLPGLEARPRKALKPSREEARLHPPARSARLRCAEKAAA